ncbi:MAG: transglycosylase SLT domain-containing protein [Betaproteobacteria bacterium]|nr:transglycosylase SLT domain-containing protein [Betaproteobacteria bacterium]
MKSIVRRTVLLLSATMVLIFGVSAVAADDSSPEQRDAESTSVNTPPAAAISRLDLSTRDINSISTLDLTSEPRDLWERMRQGFAMPNLNSDLVTDRQVWYLSRPGALKVMLERGRKYLYHIVEELEKRGMPTELALLPLVESAYNPMAYSPAKASGLWQFIPSTGRDFNLQQNWWVDERRDILASTDAALTYLQALYEMHGDWQLALASYNWGENAVLRAVNKNKAAGLPTDFSSLTMPTETRYYVPKLQALKNIIANPRLFGITLPDIPNAPYFATVDASTSMDLAAAARLAEMPVKEFLELNPSFNRPVIPGQGGERRKLVLPTDKVPTFLANLEGKDQPLLNWRTYTLTQTERVEQIAARFGISPAKLREVNGLPPRRQLAPGYTLLVPAEESVALAEAAPVLAPRLANAAIPTARVRLNAAPHSWGKSGRKAAHATQPYHKPKRHH